MKKQRKRKPFLSYTIIFMFMPFMVNIIYGRHNEQLAPKSLSFYKHNQLWWVYFIL